MKLYRFKKSETRPDYDTLQNIILDYRNFCGTKAAFYIEYLLLPGEFETKDEEVDFHLNEYGHPDSYEVIDKWHDEAVEELSTVEGKLIDTRSSLKLWRFVAIVLLVPYLVLWYFWRSNS